MGKRRKQQRVEEEERELEDFLFGDAKDVGELPLGAELPKDGGVEDLLFVHDHEGANEEGDEEEAPMRPAWEDDDDKTVAVALATKNRSRKLRNHEEENLISGADYTKRLRERHTATTSATGWAELPSGKKAKKAKGSDSDDSEDEEDILQTDEKFTSSSSSRLPQTRILMLRMKDANIMDPSKAVVQALSWHPKGQLLMTAGMDKTIRLFQIDGLRNPKAQGIHLEDLPIISACFTPDGEEIIASGRRKHFYSYHVETEKITRVPGIRGRAERSLEHMTVSPDNKIIAFLGKDGYVMLVDRKSKQWMGQVKMNSRARAVSFSPDGRLMYTLDSNAGMYVWDTASRRCVGRQTDDGSIHGTGFTSSRDGAYVAAGSDSGVVNVYSAPSLRSPNAKPLKALMNLTTPADMIRFNSDSQVLAIASGRKKDSLKLVHLPSLTTFANWPTAQTPLHYISAMEFSPNSGFLAIGNARGKVLLYRLNHYEAT